MEASVKPLPKVCSTMPETLNSFNGINRNESICTCDWNSNSCFYNF